MVKFSVELCTTPSSENPEEGVGGGGNGVGWEGNKNSQSKSGPARVNKYARILIEL